MIRPSTRRWGIGRDTAAVVFLCGALILPWNLYFGVGIPDSRTTVFAVLAAVSLLSLSSVLVARLGRGRAFDGLRLALNIPYLLLVFGFAVFDAIQTVRYGGSAQVPGGVGPGAWLGVAGALMAALPVVDDGPLRGWLASAKVLGWASIGGAALSVLFNLYWRIKYTLTGSGGSGGFGGQQVAIIGTAVVYAAVAWITVLVASRWILQRHTSSRLAVLAVGVSALIAGVLVWGLPVGRDIDEFHGIAQNTSTAGVGFEGYLVWAAAAAIFVAPASREAAADAGAWLVAVRKTLSLTAVWCLGSALMRVTDLVVAMGLHLRYSPYDKAAMIAFDAVTAAVAVWLRVNLASRSLPPAAIWSTCAVLFGFAAARIVVGVGLAPRIGGAQHNPVYGNNLAQQITSTFDVLLCVLALCSLVVAIVAVPRYREAATRPSHPRIFRPEAPEAAPRIFRTADVPEQHGRHEI